MRSGGAQHPLCNGMEQIHLPGSFLQPPGAERGGTSGLA